MVVQREHISGAANASEAVLVTASLPFRPFPVLGKLATSTAW